jgi:hypothetical protein
MNDKVIYVATKFVMKDGKTYRGINKLVVKHEIGVKKTVANFFNTYGITEFEYKSFSRKWQAMRYRIA